VHRHLVMFALLFLSLWAAISTGCSSRSAEENSDSNALSSKSASLIAPKEVTLPVRYRHHYCGSLAQCMYTGVALVDSRGKDDETTAMNVTQVKMVSES